MPKFAFASRLMLSWLVAPLSLLADDSDDASQNRVEIVQTAKVASQANAVAIKSDRVSAKEAAEKDSDKKKGGGPLKVGNFALPTSQQPSGLFAFGGNIIDKGQVQLFVFADEFIGRQRVVTDLIPSVLFGVTDDFSLLFNFPSAPLMKDGCDQSAGLADFYVQAEYAFYGRKTSCYVDQATILANVTVPTGSVDKKPATGFGSPSFFLAATYIHMRVEWFAFLGEGAILTTANRGTKIGDQFLCQCGFGRNIPSPEGWIYAWMCEIDGQYAQKNRFKGRRDANSGGSFAYVTPSLWISSKEILLQFGVSLPITQNLFGKQRKFDYALNFNFGWTVL